MLHLITDIISLVFILAGAFFVFSAAVGLVRFRDALSRVHAITKPQTVGLILTVVGAMIRVMGSPDFTHNDRGDIGVLVLLVLFALLTSPVTAQRLGRVARREGLYSDAEFMRVNEAPASSLFKKRAKKRS